MAEINLLPGELRGKEEKELEAVHKIPRVVRIEMSKPPKEKKPSFFRRLFSRQGKVKKSEDKKPPTFKPAEPPPVLPRPMAVINNHKNNGNKTQNFKANGPSELRTWDLAPAQPAPAAPKEVKGNEKLEDALKSLLEEKKPVLPEPKPLAVEKAPPIPSKPIKKEKEKKAKKDRPAVLGVNLLLRAFGGVEDLDWRRKFIISGSVGLLLVILMAGLYFGIIIYQKNVEGEIGQLKSQILFLDQEISALEKEKIDALDLQQRLKLIKDLLTSHIYWTKFFGLLEKYTIDEVYYVNFSMTGKEKLVISAVGKDYQSLAKQLLAFEQAKDFVKSVRIDSASADIDAQKAVYKGVKFNINLEFRPNIFFKPVE